MTNMNSNINMMASRMAQFCLQDDPNRPAQAVTKVSGTRVKAVLRLLSQEAGFLVDPGVKVSHNAGGLYKWSPLLAFLSLSGTVPSFLRIFHDDEGAAKDDPMHRMVSTMSSESDKLTWSRERCTCDLHNRMLAT